MKLDTDYTRYSRNPQTYKCRNCYLLFIQDDIEAGRYSKKQRKCARCIVHERVQQGTLETPNCFGELYDPHSPLCYKICTLNVACVLECADRRIESWGWQFKDWTGKVSYTKQCERILRYVATPLHVRDIGPLLNKVTNGAFNIEKKNWETHLYGILAESTAIISLGNGMYCWRGIWDGEEGIIGGYVSTKHKRNHLKPVRDFSLDNESDKNE